MAAKRGVGQKLGTIYGEFGGFMMNLWWIYGELVEIMGNLCNMMGEFQ